MINSQKIKQAIADAILVANPEELFGLALEISFSECSAYDKADLSRQLRARTRQIHHADFLYSDRTPQRGVPTSERLHDVQPQVAQTFGGAR